jgi:sec-independent protein translocase protein TatC
MAAKKTPPREEEEEKKEEDLTHVDPEHDVKMTIWEHIGELRKRLMRAAAFVLIGTIACWTFKEKLLGWIAQPFVTAWALRFPGKDAPPPELMGIAPHDILVNYMSLSLVGGIILSAPMIFYQLWAFISPGLYAREKKYVYPFVFFSTSLFLSGVAFAYYLAFPAMMSYLLSLNGDIQAGEIALHLTTRPTMELFLDFSTRMLLMFGAVFEMPLFIAFLALAGIVTPKQLVRFSRWAIIGSFVVAAIVTPTPDIFNQCIVAGALVVLYFFSVGLAFVVAKKKPKEEKS